MAEFVKSRTNVRPKVGVICGSGLGGLVNKLDTDKPKDVIPYEEIPGFPRTTGEREGEEKAGEELGRERRERGEGERRGGGGEREREREREGWRERERER